MEVTLIEIISKEIKAQSKQTKDSTNRKPRKVTSIKNAIGYTQTLQIKGSGTFKFLI